MKNLTIVFFSILTFSACTSSNRNEVLKEIKTPVIHAKTSIAPYTLVIKGVDDKGLILGCEVPPQGCLETIVISGAILNSYTEFTSAVTNGTTANYFSNGSWSDIWPDLTSDDLNILRDTANTIHAYNNSDGVVYYMVLPASYDFNNFTVGDELLVLRTLV